MKVQATRVGHYGHLRQPGDEFEIGSSKEFSKIWMRKLPGRKPKPKPAPGPAAEENREGAE